MKIRGDGNIFVKREEGIAKIFVQSLRNVIFLKFYVIRTAVHEIKNHCPTS